MRLDLRLEKEKKISSQPLSQFQIFVTMQNFISKVLIDLTPYGFPNFKVYKRTEKKKSPLHALMLRIKAVESEFVHIISVFVIDRSLYEILLHIRKKREKL